MAFDAVLDTRLEPACYILGYADDTLIVSTAGSVEVAAIRASMQTAAVVHKIQRIDFTVAAEKTKAVLFHGRKKPALFAHIRVGHEHIQVRRSLKYLGVILDSRLRFGDHFTYVAAKASKVACVLGRLMPNLLGPSETKRRLYASVVMSVKIYGALVWCDALAPASALARRRQAPMLRVQRFIALRVISAYRSVSLAAASLLACMLPLYLLAGFYRRTYIRVKELRIHDEWTPQADKDIRTMERLLMLRQWQIHINRVGLSDARVREAVAPVFLE